MANATKRKGILTGLATGLLVLVGAGAASPADEYPARPINLTVCIATGGTVDTGTRLLAESLEKILGQPVVVSNNGGGGGSVALAALAKARPDGYTLVSCPQAGLVEIPQLRSVQYKVDDFVPIAQWGEPESGTVVRSDSEFKTFQDLIEHARKNPGKVTYTVSGSFNPMHLAMLYVGKEEKIQWTAIPVPGGDPNFPLLGGHVTAFSAATSWKAHVDAGKMRLLVTHGEKRMKAFPQVPTLKELGYDFVNLSFFMVLAPKGTPAPVVKKLEDAVRKATEAPAFVAYMNKASLPIAFRGSEETRKHIDEANRRFAKMVVELQLPKQ